MESAMTLQEPVYSLNKAFLVNFPLNAARKLETMEPAAAAEVIGGQDAAVISRVIEKMSPGSTLPLLAVLPGKLATEVLTGIDTSVSVTMLASMVTETLV